MSPPSLLRMPLKFGPCRLVLQCSGSPPCLTRSISSASASSPKRKKWIPITATVTAIAAATAAYVYANKHESPYRPYEVVSKTPVSATSCIVAFRPTKPSDIREIYNQIVRKGCWSVIFGNFQSQISRHYTPLPPEDSIEDSDFALRFLVRKVPGGEMSGELFDSVPGSTFNILVPGRVNDYRFPKGLQEVLFIAAGTGIASALQAAYAFFDQNTDANAKFHILWASRHGDDCAGRKHTLSWWDWLMSRPKPAEEKNEIVKYIEALTTKYPNRLTVDYFVDDEGTIITQNSILGAIGDDQPGKRTILICGPDGFNAYMAGPKLYDQHGRVIHKATGGLVGQMSIKGHLNGWGVYKLY